MPEHALLRLLLSVAALLAAAVVGGQAARRCGLPAIVGELLGGVALGPTLLGRLAPALHDFLFPAVGPVAAERQVVLTAGLLGFLFVAGLEMDLSCLRGRFRAVAGLAACGVAVPFALGALSVAVAPSLFGGTLPPAMMAAFVGTALSISALPVIARTLMDLGLHRTALAGLVLSAAVVDDLVGWSLFAFLSRAVAGAPSDLVFSLARVGVLFLLVLTLGRFTVARLRPILRRWMPDMAPRLALAASLVFAFAGLAEMAGVHAVLGGFLAGVVMSQGAHREDVHDVCHAFGAGVLAPLYFASVGLRADFVASLDVRLTVWVIAVACAGKMGAAAFAGRWMGLPLREALALGAALNARGAMEILLAGAAREQGLIDARLFVSLVVMALVTSLMSGPLLVRLLKPAVSIAVPGSAPATAS
jgi:Kef-type K+ transport system membrane component KefB